MRVLLVSHRFPPDQIGGVERYTQALATDLTRQGDNVSIVARRSEPGRRDAQTIRERLLDGTRVYRMTAGAFRYDRFLEQHDSMDHLFGMVVVESMPDVVHINHLMGFTPNFIQIAHRLGAAVVISLHDFYFACPRVHLQKPGGELCEGPDHGHECANTCFANAAKANAVHWGLRNMYFQRALALADRVIAYSNHVASYFGQTPDIAPITVIPNGVPEHFVNHRDLNLADARSSRFHFAYCGTVVPHKGPHLILDALRLAQLDATELLVIGHMPDREYGARLRAKADSIPGLTLRMYGNYNRSELPLLLRGVDCVIVPSLVPEAGPIAPREALALGVPIVVAKLGALPELVVEGDNGLTFDPERPSQLAAILRRMTQDKDLLPRLRAGALRSPVVTLQDHARNVRTIYGEAVQRFNRRTHDPFAASELNFLQSALLTLSESPRHADRTVKI